MPKKFRLNPVPYTLLAILIIATFLRFYQITVIPPGFYPDEAMNGNNALEALSTKDFRVFYPENNGREGLLINVQAVLMGALHRLNLLAHVNQPWVLRLPSAFFGVLTVVGLYFLTREMFRRHPEQREGSRDSSPPKADQNDKAEYIALLAAFLMATGFWHINFSRIGFRAILAPFFLVWSLYFLIFAYRSIAEKTSRFYFLASSFLAGIFYGLGFYTYIAYRATPLLIVIIYYLMSRKIGWRAASRPFLIFAAVAVITLLPITIYFIAHPADFLGRSGQVSIFSSPTPLQDLALNIVKTAGEFNISGDWNWRHNIAGRPLLFWPVGLLFVVGLGVAAGDSIKNHKTRPPHDTAHNNKNVHLFLLAWLLVAALPVVISDEGIPHALRSILMAPAVYLLAAIGGIWLYDRITLSLRSAGWRRSNLTLMFLKSVVAIFSITLIFNAYSSYFLTWAKNPEVQGAFTANYAAIGRELNALPRDLPKYVLIKAGGVDVRGLPMPAQTVMFLTNTFLPANQRAKNIHYILPQNAASIPPGAYVAVLE